jgi:hypothetical protein
MLQRLMNSAFTSGLLIWVSAIDRQLDAAQLGGGGGMVQACTVEVMAWRLARTVTGKDEAPIAGSTGRGFSETDAAVRSEPIGLAIEDLTFHANALVFPVRRHNRCYFEFG